MIRKLSTALMGISMLVALSAMPLPAAAAAAAGSCSIQLPPRFAIATETTVITAHPGSDCAASDMSSAYWNVSPSNYGDSFSFFAGTLSDSYTFYASLDQVGVLRAVPTGASSSTGYNDLTQNSPTYIVKYATWAYIASSRQGAAVYINGLIHQWSSNDLAPGAGRTLYLQRYLPTGWQNMLTRTASSSGRVTVGFIQTRVYQYRWLVTETSTAWNARSASTFR